VLDYFAEGGRVAWTESANSRQGSPLDSLRKLFGDTMVGFQDVGCTGGCPIGNLAQEMGDLNEAFRQRIEEIIPQARPRPSLSQGGSVGCMHKAG
jgi:TetR/AcrR family transcriptional regulator, transcriptional repressor for nem operon